MARLIHSCGQLNHPVICKYAVITDKLLITIKQSRHILQFTKLQQYIQLSNNKKLVQLAPLIPHVSVIRAMKHNGSTNPDNL